MGSAEAASSLCSDCRATRSAGAAGPESGRVYKIGLHTRFRGLTVRQGLVWRGQAGWAEWSPFLEYGPDEARIWLRAAILQDDLFYHEYVEQP